MFQKIKSYLSKGNRAQWCIFALFALIIFFKCILFQWNVYHSLAISSIIHDPLSFWSFWLPKIAIVCLITSFVFISRKYIWSIVTLFLLDIWMLANMMYLRSNGLVLDGYAFTMVNNMDGFWSSCISLLEWSDLIPVSSSFIYLIFILFLKRNLQIIPRQWKTFGTVFTIALFLNWGSFVLVRQFECRFYAHGIGNLESVWKSITFNPFSTQSRERMKPMNKDYAFANFSLIHGFIFDILDYIDIQKGIKYPYQLTEEEKNQIRPFEGLTTTIQHKNLLLILIIESLESWTIQPEIMPNLYTFIKKHPTLYVKYSKSQTVGGSSGDGQMILNTGLLPVKEGATCFRFPYIEYPSIIDRNDSSATILTHSAHCWNQSVMSDAYGYTQLIEGDWQDEILSQRVINYASRGYRTIQAITITSHIPFEHHFESKLNVSDKMPVLMAKYCKCLNLTDEGLKDLFAAIDTLPALKNATIMITGDHSIFWGTQREDFAEFCKQNNLDWSIEMAACPVIFYSPKIKENILIEDVCYQMDIFPTLLHITDNKDYYWKGFGVNLLDSVARKNRPISEQEAFILSDKLIRANWFESYTKEK